MEMKSASALSRLEDVGTFSSSSMIVSQPFEVPLSSDGPLLSGVPSSGAIGARPEIVLALVHCRIWEEHPTYSGREWGDPGSGYGYLDSSRYFWSAVAAISVL